MSDTRGSLSLKVCNFRLELTGRQNPQVKRPNDCMRRGEGMNQKDRQWLARQREIEAVRRERTGAYWAKKREEEARQREEDARRHQELREQFPRIVATAFLVRSCPRCHENRMGLVSISPNANSIEYRCETCGRKQRAAAGSPEAMKIKDLAEGYNREVEKFAENAKLRRSVQRRRRGSRPGPIKTEVPVYFLVPEATMPYEQTTRGPVTEAMRAEVYRRDGGKCVTCGRKENLQYDHILPVAKGGATTVKNLQLLCRTCNLSKGAKI